MSLDPLPPSDPSDDMGRLPPHLRRLQRLVTTLTVVMILGFIALIAALILRLNAEPALRGGGVAQTDLAWPEGVNLPEDTRPTAVTRGSDWVAVVTDDDRILIFDAATGALRQQMSVE